MAWVTGTPTPSSAGPSQATSPAPDVRTVLTYVSLSTGISCHPAMRACPAVRCRGPAPRHLTADQRGTRSRRDRMLGTAAPSPRLGEFAAAFGQRVLPVLR